jgi:hypothetical protein
VLRHGELGLRLLEPVAERVCPLALAGQRPLGPLGCAIGLRGTGAGGGAPGRAQIDELNAELVVARAEAARALAQEQARADRLSDQIEAGRRDLEAVRAEEHRHGPHRPRRPPAALGAAAAEARDARAG